MQFEAESAVLEAFSRPIRAYFLVRDRIRRPSVVVRDTIIEALMVSRTIIWTLIGLENTSSTAATNWI